MHLHEEMGVFLVLSFHFSQGLDADAVILAFELEGAFIGEVEEAFFFHDQDAGLELVHLSVAFKGETEDIPLLGDGKPHILFEGAEGELFADLVEYAIEDKPAIALRKTDDGIGFGGAFDACLNEVEHGFVGEDIVHLFFKEGAKLKGGFGGLGIIAWWEGFEVIEAEQEDGFEFLFLPCFTRLPLSPVPACQDAEDGAEELEQEIEKGCESRSDPHES